MSEAKIFVGGLSWTTDQDALKTYFQSFGEVTDVTLKTDQNTGKSRGFGFVTFADPASVSQVMSTPEHKLDGRTIDPKVAKAKGGREPVLKVFVGGLDPEVSEDEIRAHFGQYGAIDEVDLPFDKVKQQRRAFCFIKFQTEEVVNSVLSSNNANNKQILCGKEVDVKKATPKNDQGGEFGGYGGRGGFGGRGGGRGRGRGGYGGGYGGQQSYGGGYGSGGYGSGGYSSGYGNGYSNGSGYGGSSYGSGYDQSGYGGQKGYSGYGAGDDSYGGYGGASSAAGWGGQQSQQRSSGYHPYQR